MTGSTLFSLTRFDRASNLQFIQTIKFLSMDSRYLQSFVYVAELGSIAEAARRLDLTPAAVGQRVKLLEEELGMRLIQRSGRTVSATPAGARILERGRKVLRDIRDLRADVVDDTSLSGELRLGATPTLMTALIPRLVSTLLGEHPQVDIYLEPGNSVALYSKVLDGELDAALIIRPLFDLPKSCGWHTMREEPLVLLTPESMQVSDVRVTLETEPFLRYDRTTVGGRIADDYLRQQGIKTHQRCELDGLDALAALVSRGLGVSLVPHWLSAPGYNVPLARWPLPGSRAKRVVGMVWSRASARIRLVESFLQLAQGWDGKP
jgi:DNA-binding transcriptional LysR family regulator